MSKETYIKIKEWFLHRAIALKVLKFLYVSLPAAVFILYPVMLLLKALKGFDTELLLMVCIPAGVLVTVTVIRKLISRPRPYDKFGIAPLINKNDRHPSMPSRHTASAFIIAMSGFALSVPLGVTLLIVASVIGATRVLAGVHFISDVLCAALISITAGSVFIFI